MHAYHRDTGETMSFVWGKRDLQTAKKLKKKLSDSGISYGNTATGDRDSFTVAFKGENHSVGKEYTVGIE
ncbi:MAG: hypothetical protein LBG45_04410 [Dysgonamonadaceae bacterium]|nr:hypothetical protein [Dysgonamonadaceae bacterium]